MQEALKFHHDSKQERGLGPIVMPIVVDALEKKYHEQITPFSGSQTSSIVRRWSSSCVLYALLPTERPLAALQKDPLVLVYIPICSFENWHQVRLEIDTLYFSHLFESI